MKKQWSILWGAGWGAAVLGAGSDAWALSDDKRFERLERHIMELEKRLEASEAENAKLRTLIQPTTGPAPAGKAAAGPDVKALDQKVKLLERKLEIDKEVAENARKTTPKVDVGPATGLRVTSPEGDHQVRLRGFVQADGDFFLNGDDTGAAGVGVNSTTGQPNPIQPGNGEGIDKFWIRRARLQVQGTMFKYADFLVAPDFGAGQVRLFDANLDLHYFRFASLSAGKQKAPISLERIQRAPELTFVERAYPNELAPNREIGVMLHGEFAKPGYEPFYTFVNQSPEFVSYQVGVFNASLDNQAVQNSDTATFNPKSFNGRVFTHPFQHSGIDWLEFLGVGFAGSYGDISLANNIPALTSPGQNNIVTYNTSNPTLTSSSVATAVVQANTPSTGKQTTTTTTTTTSSAFSGALSNGEQYRFYPQGYWYYGPIGLLWEYVWSSQSLAVQQTDTTSTTVATAVRTNTAPNTTSTVTRSSTTATATGPTVSNGTRQDNQAWQIALSYVVTGEDNTFQGVRPRHPFSPLEGQWGAWQLAFRWHELDIDPDTFKNFGTAAKPLYLYSDPRSSVQHASTWAVGANWFLNQSIKFQADYEQTEFTGGAVTADKQIADRPTEKVFFTRFQFQY